MSEIKQSRSMRFPVERLDAIFETLLQSLNDAVTIVDPTGTVLYWNRAAEMIYGIPREAIVGAPIDRFFPAGSVMLFKVLRSRRPVHRLYHRPRPDKHVLINAYPIFSASRELIGAIAVEQDITEHVALSAALYGAPEAAPEEGTTKRLLDILFPDLLDLAGRIAAALKERRPVLLLGERGSGREALARYVHRTLGLEGPFLVFHSRLVPDGFQAAELFGFEGPGGGAPEAGLLERARDGLLFLKDVDAWPEALQAALAEALAGGRYVRQGGREPLPVAARLIAAAGPDLPAAVEAERFLPELFYRFFVFSLPPLRARRKELPALVRHLIDEAARALGRPAPRLTDEALAALLHYDWPGNLPQLKNALEYAVLMADGGTVELRHLPEPIRARTLLAYAPEPSGQGRLPGAGAIATAAPRAPGDRGRAGDRTEGRAEDPGTPPRSAGAAAVTAPEPASSPMRLERLPEARLALERERILAALGAAGGNKSRAAKLLGISRGALYYKLRQLGIEKDLST
ncbi:MAG: sigma 54-interacting transcriptional regulator [Hydrogenibacillus schlegelii]|uniref:Sigma 54-interacting transcriptional regulator n=1 Tax=Hydrogenibacillus schlegelii TaxID=1484 RepID=A0A947D472_HYDSH|nr:sigma 54-interacting transcriptional regulator [Hydrogenibacillus schlegelii]MBT9282483.1 sigma 54-interacting transcriptional regulator [Hydrogenibacillus schlegelii]